MGGGGGIYFVRSGSLCIVRWCADGTSDGMVFKDACFVLTPHMFLLNLTIGWVALLHISEVLGSNSSPRWPVMTGFSQFSEVLPSICRGGT